jgi:hypothetical protein
VAQNVIDWVWKHSRAVNGSLIVLLAIAHEAGRDGMVIMSAPELAQKTRLSERSVRASTMDLKRSGELIVRPGAGDHGRNGYQVIMVLPTPRGAESAPLTPADSAPLNGCTPADSAPLQNLHGAESAPLTPADSAPLDAHPPSPEAQSGSPTQARGADSAPLEISDVLKTSTGIDEVEVKDVPAIASRPDVEHLCAHLADRIEANGSKRPAPGKKWRDAARLMIDRDGRTEQQVIAAIDWAQDDEFWRSNILSMPKLREKYDQLRLQAGRARQNGRASTTDDRVRAGLELAEKYARQERGELPS